MLDILGIFEFSSLFTLDTNDFFHLYIIENIQVNSRECYIIFIIIVW